MLYNPRDVGRAADLLRVSQLLLGSSVDGCLHLRCWLRLTPY